MPTSERMHPREDIDTARMESSEFWQINLQETDMGHTNSICTISLEETTVFFCKMCHQSSYGDVNSRTPQSSQICESE